MKRSISSRKVAIVLLIFVLVLTSLPITMSSVYGNAGPADGQIEYIGGGEKATGDYYIETSKTIKEVQGKENYFDITLKTKTKRHRVNMSTDVVLVLDISNTMNTDRYGNSGVADANKKLTQAKNATNDFIDAFATNPNLDSNRKISVVTFNSDASVPVALTEANDASDTAAIKRKVNGITAPGFSSTRRFTNIEAGLQLAQNILANNSTARFKYIILMTDGFPTTYIQGNRTSTTGLTGYNTIMSGAYNATTAGQASDGYFANTRTKQLCTGGTSYSNKAAIKAENVAKNIRNAGINVFCVGIALASQNINNFLTYIIDTTGMSASAAYAIGNTDQTYRAWLENKIAGGPLLANSNNKYADAYNPNEWKTDFNAIMRDIERAPDITNREFYTIDPMSDVADFIGFYNKDGKLVGDTLTGQSKEKAEDTAVYGKSYGGQTNNDTIYWDKMKSGFTTDSEGYLVYELTYRVRLKNEKSGFSWATPLETNDRTVLYYSQVYEESGAPVPDGSGDLDYGIPKVEGYRGSLKFKKIDGETNEALAGAEFVLRHHGDSCDVCQGDAAISDRTVISGTDGMVEFKDIPSGHEYVLIEKTPPEGYKPIHNHEIIVSYGDTCVGLKDAEHKLVDGVMNGQPFQILNTKIEPVEIQLQVTKTMDGEVPQAALDGAYRFLLRSKVPNTHEGYHREYAQNQFDETIGKSIAVFDRLVFDSVHDDYEYEIVEVAGTDSTTVYDNTLYEMAVNMELIDGGNKYQAVVTVKKGTEQIFRETFVGTEGRIEMIQPEGLVFKNETRGAGTAELEAKKYMLDAEDQPVALQGDEFAFQLRDAEGNLLQTKRNAADGTIDFDGIDYDKVGTYHYTLSEVQGEDSSISYDVAVYDVIVTVTAPDPYQEKYSVDVSYQKKGEDVSEASFTNRERKIPTLEVTGLKTLNGQPAEAGLFFYKHVELDDNGKEIDGTEKIFSNGDDGLIFFDFKDIVTEMIDAYNKKDANEPTKFHDYRLYEVKDQTAMGDETIIYDDTYYELLLAVDAPVGEDSYTLSAYLYRIDGDERTTVYYTDQSTHIAIGVTGDYDIHFDNASTVDLHLEGIKHFLDAKGEPIRLKAGQFAFTLQDESGNTLQTVKNQADGKFAFAPVTLKNDAVGTHTYVVYEDTAEADRIKDVYYDEAVYTVEFEVKKDAHGHLSVTEPVFKKSGEVADVIAFVNQEMNESHLQITVGKTVNGETPDIMKKFDFQLKAVEAPVGVDVSKAPLYQVVQNTEGHAAFEMFAFETLKAGRYVFEISEVVPAGAALVDGKYVLNKMTYDPTVHKVVVDVTKAGNVVEKVVTVNGEALAADQVQFQVNFDNQYDPEPAKVQLKAQKTLTGRDMKAGEFEFELLDDKGKVLQTKQNQAAEAGKADVITFDELSFDQIGNFVYTVKEKAGQLGGIKYDEKAYTVTVNVKDDNQGQLYTEILVDGRPLQAEQKLESVIAFQNTYETSDAMVQLVGRKTMEGRALQRNEFTFELYQVTAEGKQLIQSIKNGSVERNPIGSIAFEMLYFNQPGTYQYEVKEVAGEADGVFYDQTVYMITVVVEDNGEGKLIHTVSYEAEDAVADEIVFENRYEPEPEPQEESEQPDEPKTPEDDDVAPGTGDTTSLFLWLIILAASGAGLAGATVYKRRRG